MPVAFIVRSNGSDISEDEIKKYISAQVRDCLVVESLHASARSEFDGLFGNDEQVVFYKRIWSEFLEN